MDDLTSGDKKQASSVGSSALVSKFPVNITRVSEVIRTPDQRLRVFISSTLQELAEERKAAREAILQLHLTPVMFELGASPHPPKDLYRAYLTQSQIFIGIYLQKYGWVAPGESLSGLEDEYRKSGGMSRLIYIKQPAPDREPRLKQMLDDIKSNADISFKYFARVDELPELIENDLAHLLSERFEVLQESASDAKSRRARTNVPTPRNTFIGRDKEMSAARELLLREDVSLVTLTGAGGTGKSRLGLHIALSLLDSFRDGVFLVHLQSITDPELVVGTIAQTLSIQESVGGKPLMETLEDFLRNKQMLLLLDNFEQVIGAAPQIAELLEACTRVKILVTSRVSLRLRSEHELPIHPLTMPEAKEFPSLVTAFKYSALNLFVQRAQSAKPGFALTQENLCYITKICSRLDGLPLAIELAAARIKILSPQALLDRLAHRFDILRGGTRDLPPRQQTLRDAINWSYMLLDDGAKTLLRRLSVFVGGFDLEAVEAVCSLPGELLADTLDELEMLVSHNLITQSEDANDEARFGMLETIREFAVDCMETEGGEADLIRGRHAQFFLNLATSAEPFLRSRERTAWLPSLERELGNIRAALAWFHSNEFMIEHEAQLACALDWFWFFGGHLTEGRKYLENLLDRARMETENPHLLAQALSSAGGLAWAQGDLENARAWLEKSMAIDREMGEIEHMRFAQSLTFLGFVNVSQGRGQEAQALHTESLALSRKLGDKWLQALTLSNFGDSLLLTGDIESARDRFSESLDLFSELDDTWGSSVVYYALGSMALFQGSREDASIFFDESASLSRSTKNHWGLARALLGLAGTVLAQGNFPRAQKLFQESLTLEYEVGNTGGMAAVLAGLAAVAAAQRNARRSARLAGASEELTKKVPVRLWQVLRPICEDHIRSIRNSTDTTAWNREYGAGKAMSIQDAVAYAMDESSELNSSGEV